MAFKCILVTPDQQLLDLEITQAIVPAYDGLMGILTHRAPIMAKLGIGPLRIDTADGKSQHFFIDGGIAQMKENTLTILTTQAKPASEIDARQAADEYTAAVALRGTSPQELDARQTAIQLAQAKQAVAAKAR